MCLTHPQTRPLWAPRISEMNSPPKWKQGRSKRSAGGMSTRLPCVPAAPGELRPAVGAPAALSDKKSLERIMSRGEDIAALQCHEEGARVPGGQAVPGPKPKGRSHRLCLCGVQCTVHTSDPGCRGLWSVCGRRAASPAT